MGGACDQAKVSWLLGVVVVSDIVVAALLVWLSQTSGGEGEIQELLAEVPHDGTALGSENALVTVYLYDDLQCPACAAFARETFPELVRRYVESGTGGGKGHLRDDRRPQTRSIPAARAAFAAGKQDRY